MKDSPRLSDALDSDNVALGAVTMITRRAFPGHVSAILRESSLVGWHPAPSESGPRVGLLPTFPKPARIKADCERSDTLNAGGGRARTAESA